MGRASIIGCVGISVLLSSAAACSDLTVPPAPGADGGSSGNGTSSGVVQGTQGSGLPPYAPQGAILGESKNAMGATLATWHTVDANGKVATLGWNLPLASVKYLDGAPYETRIFLKFADQVSKETLVTGQSYGYMPHGHIPNGVYDLPHWDFHLAFQDLHTLETLDCSDSALPEPSIVPQFFGVVPPPENCWPLMGIHAVDWRSPEFNGQRFSYSGLLIYYRGAILKAQNMGAKITSFEPMFSVDFLNERKPFGYDLPAFPPNSIGRAGLQPMKVQVDYRPAPDDAFVVTVSNWQPAN